MSTGKLLPVIALAIACFAVGFGSEAQGRRAQQPAKAKQSTEKSFRDCAACPLMVPVPAGEFMMGSPDSEARRNPDESPQHRVAIAQPFAIGKYEVTFAEWDACVAKGGCTHKPGDEGWGRGRHPVVNISWNDAIEFVGWLAKTTGKPYRLPTEAEWEYAARAAANGDAKTEPFSTGATISYRQANYDANFVYGPGRIGIYRQKTLDVGSLPRNAFGIHEMHGNAWEWVQDCYKPDYREAPTDGTAVTSADCQLRIMRGGAWNYYPWTLRSAHRHASSGEVRLNNVGLRVARSL